VKINVIPEALMIVTQIRMDLRIGKSLSAAIDASTSISLGHFSKALRTWLIRTEAGHLPEEIMKALPFIENNIAHRSLVRILAKGLRGMPVDDALSELEQEFYSMTAHKYERQLQLLPMKLLVPLTLLILPGMMLLILGPVLFRLSTGF
jgi:hypothetical protein